VLGSGGAPTGTVTFMLGTTVLGTSGLTAVDANDAGATLPLSGAQLAPGSNSLTAAYSGDTNYPGSTSSVVTVELLP